MKMAESSFPIKIRSANRTQTEVFVQCQTSIAELKLLLEQEIGLAVPLQKLIFQGKVLLDSETISSSHIESGFVVQVVASQSRAPIPSPEPQTVEPSRQGRFLGLILGNPPGSFLIRRRRFPHRRREVSWSHKLECVRQNIQTLEAIFYMRRDGPLVSDPLQAFDFSRRKFKEGQWVDVQDTVNQWLEAQIMGLRTSFQHGEQAWIHYLGWPQRWDEWIETDSLRIQFFRMKTKQAVYSPMQSPYPLMIMDAFGVMNPAFQDFSELFFQGVDVLGRVRPLVDRYNDLHRFVAAETFPVLTSPEVVSSDFSESEGSARYYTAAASEVSQEESMEEDRTDETPAKLELVMLGRQLGPILDRCGKLLTDLSLLVSTRPDSPVPSLHSEEEICVMPPQSDLVYLFPDLPLFSFPRFTR